jgi:hypothetical protein
MLLTDQFVFVHMPHTGGTFVYDTIKTFFPSARELGYHLPRSLLPGEYSSLPILGTVRNPWDFYVSWYHFQKFNTGYSPSKNALFYFVSEDRKLNFSDTIRNALDLATNNDKLDALLRLLPESFDFSRRTIPNLTRHMMEQIRGTGLGLYTFRFYEMFGQTRDVFFCRVENLRNDLLEFFERIGVLNPELRSYVLGAVKKNTSDHYHYARYYTSELADLVSERDHRFIETFVYTFDSGETNMLNKHPENPR